MVVSGTSATGPRFRRGPAARIRPPFEASVVTGRSRSEKGPETNGSIGGGGRKSALSDRSRLETDQRQQTDEPTGARSAIARGGRDVATRWLLVAASQQFWAFVASTSREVLAPLRLEGFACDFSKRAIPHVEVGKGHVRVVPETPVQ